LSAGAAEPEANASTGSRPVYFGADFGALETPVFTREKLRAGNRIEGPALIEEAASTTVLNPGDLLKVDPFGNLVITISARG
jgi:N-methylhydantoinase A